MWMTLLLSPTTLDNIISNISRTSSNWLISQNDQSTQVGKFSLKFCCVDLWKMCTFGTFGANIATQNIAAFRLCSIYMIYSVPIIKFIFNWYIYLIFCLFNSNFYPILSYFTDEKQINKRLGKWLGKTLD